MAPERDAALRSLAFEREVAAHTLDADRDATASRDHLRRILSPMATDAALDRVATRKHLAQLADRVAAARDHYEDELAVRDEAIVVAVEAGLPGYLAAEWAKVSPRQARRALAKV